jgi:hypothetical protein
MTCEEIMATFPKLKTAAVAQYPAAKGLIFRNHVVRFLDGKEQRYRESAGSLHRWQIRLAELDETEMAAIDAFFVANQGRLGYFVFTDPWDGTVYPNCSVEGDQMEWMAVDEMRGRAAVTVVENREK